MITLQWEPPSYSIPTKIILARYKSPDLTGTGILAEEKKRLPSILLLPVHREFEKAMDVKVTITSSVDKTKIG